MSIATMNNYEDFQATLLQLAQDPSTDTELFTRLFLAYKEHVSLKEATTHLAKMMIKEEPPGGEQEPKTPTSTPPLIDDKPHTPGVSLVKETGKYRASKWNKDLKNNVNLGHAHARTHRVNTSLNSRAEVSRLTLLPPPPDKMLN